MIGFAIVAAALPNFKLFMSMGQLIILGNWLLEGMVRHDLLGRFSRAFRNPAAAALVALYLVYVLGLSYTENIEWGFDLCRIMLPFLFLPVVASSIQRFTSNEWRAMLSIFAVSAVFTSIVGYVQFTGLNEPSAFRQLSPLISHIRMGMMVAMAVFILLWFFPKVGVVLKVTSILLVLWCVYYLNMMRSVQGLIVVTLGATIILLARASSFQLVWKNALRLAAVLLPLAGILYIWNAYSSYYNVDEQLLDRLPERSANGEVYYHNLEDPMIENGRYVWVNVAREEIQKGWDERSDISFNSRDAKGQPIRSTLIRYMTSKGLNKDLEGLEQMTQTDIQRVEQGIPNIDMLERSGLRNRVDQVIFEVDRYKAKGDPSGNSFTMRLEFWRTAWAIIQQNFWIGVGTGDTPQAFEDQYIAMDTPLAENMRFRAHNQYLTVWVSFGIIGLIVFFIALFYPFFREGLWKHGLAGAFLVATLVSFITDDTLERQAGVTFVAYFYSLFLFLKPSTT